MTSREVLSRFVVVLLAVGACSDPTTPDENEFGVKELKTSFATTCAIVEPGGKLYCWGYNRRGPVGIGTEVTPQPLPVEVSGGLSFNKVTTGTEHTCGMTSSGPYCWGGFSAAVIAETRPVANGMVPIKVFGGERFVELESNGATVEVDCSDQTCRSLTCGIDGLRDLYCWEALSPSENPPQLNPQRVVGAPKVASLSLGMTHACVIDASDKLWCWGDNVYRQAGQPGIFVSAPTQVAADLKFKAVSAGRAHTCAIEASGDVYCWGANSANQLAAESSETCALRFINVPCRSTPVKVAGSYKFVSISAGGGSPVTTGNAQKSHTCGITTTEALVCWGWNANGQLGDGTTVDKTAPTPVSSNIKFISVTTGAVHTCAISNDRRAYCWGSNNWGQLGTGTTNASVLPVPVAGHLASL